MRLDFATVAYYHSHLLHGAHNRHIIGFRIATKYKFDIYIKVNIYLFHNNIFYMVNNIYYRLAKITLMNGIYTALFPEKGNITCDYFFCLIRKAYINIAIVIVT